MTATLLPEAEQTFVDSNGVPLAGGTVQFYIPNTSTPKNTWQDSGQTILNTNPIVLDSSGRAIIYGSGIYRQVLKDSLGNTIWDQLTSSSDAGLLPISGGTITGNLAVNGTLSVGGLITATSSINLPSLVASELLATDSSKNIVNVTTLPAGTMATTQPATDSSTDIATTAQVASVVATYINSETGFLPTAITGSSTTAAVTISVGSVSPAGGVLAYIRTTTTTPWLVGNGNAINGYQGGATLPNNTTIHFYACSGTSGTGVFAVANGTTPVFPTGYNTSSHRIFSIYTDSSGNLVPYSVMEINGGGLLCMLASPVFDYSATGAISATNVALSLPLGLNIIFKGLISLQASTGTNTRSVSFSYNPTSAVSLVLTTGAGFSGTTTEIQVPVFGDQLLHNLTVVGGDANVTLLALGWYDARR